MSGAQRCVARRGERQAANDVRIRTDDTEHGYLLHIGACLGDRLL